MQTGRAAIASAAVREGGEEETRLTALWHGLRTVPADPTAGLRAFRPSPRNRRRRHNHRKTGICGHEHH